MRVISTILEQKQRAAKLGHKRQRHSKDYPYSSKRQDERAKRKAARKQA